MSGSLRRSPPPAPPPPIDLAASVVSVAWLLRTAHPRRIVAYIRAAIAFAQSVPLREGHARRR